MLLSVVIPFYQVEAYIGECLLHVAKLPTADCEVLMVDDCGSDGSRAIAQAFATKHENFRLLTREKNGGLSAARNTGLAQATGKYVYFLDSDDLPQAHALYALAKAAQAQQLDVAKARFCYFDDVVGRQWDGPALHATQVMAGDALFAQACRENVYEPMVWQCLFRRAFLKDLRLEMPEGLLFEDELFQTPALLAAARAAVFEGVILLYRQREGSIMASFAHSTRWCGCYLEVCRRLAALAERLPLGEPRQMLKRRVGQIAISVAKNIPAYRLPKDIADEAMAFVRANLRELTGYAIDSGNAVVAAQGLLLRLSLRLFIAAYSRV